MNKNTYIFIIAVFLFLEFLEGIALSKSLKADYETQKSLISSSIETSKKINAYKKDIEDIKVHLDTLELYLKDKKDHSENCSWVKWEQPDIEEYQNTHISHLPERCKKK